MTTETRTKSYTPRQAAEPTRCPSCDRTPIRCHVTLESPRATYQYICDTCQFRGERAKSMAEAWDSFRSVVAGQTI